MDHHPGTATRGNHSLGMSDIAVIQASYVKLRKRKKQKMKQKSLRTFEKRYSNLAQRSALIPERKRIDYILLHESVYSKDMKDESKKKELLKHESNRKKFEELMDKEGFSIQRDTVGDHVYVKLHCPFKRLCYEAEKVKIEMPLKDCRIPPSSPGNWIQRFSEAHLSTDADVADFVSGQFSVDKIDKFEGHEDPTNFFRPSVRSLLVNHILINLDIRTAKEIQEDALDSSDSENDDHDCFRCPEFCKELCSCCKKSPNAASQKSNSSLKKKGLPYLLMKGSYSNSFVLHDDSDKSQLREDTPSDDLIPVKKPAKPREIDPRRDLDDKWTKFYKYQPMWHIRNYFGEKIAFYFAWTGMLITTLWIPMLFGLAVFLYGLYERVSQTFESTNSTQNTGAFKDVLFDIKRAFDNDVTPYFALFICCWGTIFLEVWKRKRATLAYEWDVDMFESNEPDRPQFFGTKVKKDPVTDEDNWFYPFRRQFLKFSASYSVLFFMVSVVIVSVFAVIVYRVIIDADYCPGVNNGECFLITTLVSSVLNAVSILILGKLYEKLAVKLTDWENHRTQTKYDDALIIKLFAFQFVNSYASCFYIAFFRGRWSLFEERYMDSCEGSCMTQLSFQVLTLMLAKPFPKFFKDIIIPFVKRMWHRRPQWCHFGCLSCCRRNQVTGIDDGVQEKKLYRAHIGFLERERLKPSLGDFTMAEYTEKIILYGFLMLFASSFPLAPLLALVICCIDIRVDAKRMLWWYQRPVAFIAEDIGMWFDILTLVNFIGVTTNAFIIAFTSSWGQQFELTGKLWIVIGFEHIVFVLKFILAYLIPDTPQDVRLAIRREKYLVQRKLGEGSPSSKDIDYTQLFPVDMLPSDAITEEVASTDSNPAMLNHSNSKTDHSLTKDVTTEDNETTKSLSSPQHSASKQGSRKKSKSLMQILSKRSKNNWTNLQAEIEQRESLNEFSDKTTMMDEERQPMTEYTSSI